MFQSKIPSS